MPRLGVCCASRINSPKIACKEIFYAANSERTKGSHRPDKRDFWVTSGAKIHKYNRPPDDSRRNYGYPRQLTRYYEKGSSRAQLMGRNVAPSFGKYSKYSIKLLDVAQKRFYTIN
jgi:hypothetical protein